MRRILCDCDGVLSNFIEPAFGASGIPYDPAGFKGSWNRHRALGVTDDELWAPIDNYEFWISLEPYPAAMRLYVGLLDISGGEVTIATAPSHNPCCAAAKIQWLRRLLGPDFSEFMIGYKKELMAGNGNLLLDDGDHNVKHFREAGGRAVLYPRPWNSRYNEYLEASEDEVVDKVLREVRETYA